MDTSSGYGDASTRSAATEAGRYSGLGQRATQNDTASPRSADFTAADQPGAASTATGPLAAERLMEDLQSLRSALELLVAARYDQIKLSLRRALLWGLLAAVAVFAIGALAVKPHASCWSSGSPVAWPNWPVVGCGWGSYRREQL